MVTELLHEGDLHHALFQSDRMVTESKKLAVLMGIAQGLEYLHRKHIVHADVKVVASPQPRCCAKCIVVV